MGSCGSLTSVAADLWKEYGEVAKQVGCFSAVALSKGMIPYEACYDGVTQYEETVKKMIAFWNKMAKNGWATIGPRRLEIGSWLEGRLVSTGGRVFIAETPLNKDTIDITLKKTDGKAHTSVTVCKYAENGKSTTLWDFEVDSGKETVGDTFKKTLNGVRNHLISVHLDAKSVTNTFAYKLLVEKR